MSQHVTEPGQRLVSLVFRLPAGKKKAVEELAARTRVRQSEHLRKAVADLLRKHGVEP